MNNDIKQALDVLYKGGVILYPTDTIWGIGCDATNPEAVKRVYDIKRRMDSKAMLVLIDSPAKLNFYVKEVPPVAWDLMELTTKPLTIIYDGARNLAPNLIAEDGSVAYGSPVRSSRASSASASARPLYLPRPTSVANRHQSALPTSVTTSSRRWITSWATGRRRRARARHRASSS